MAKNIFLIGLMLAVFITPFSLRGQVFSGNNSERSADSLIQILHEGALIVPLMKQSKRTGLLKQFSEDPAVREKDRIKFEKQYPASMQSMELFNQAIRSHFKLHYDFSEVYFVADSSLSDFHPESAVFIDPSTGIENPEIQMGHKNYFFVQYYQTSGVATNPASVGFLYIADQHFNPLQRPFPHSPGRGMSYKMRFWDLLNIGPDTGKRVELLVIGLNDKLHQYLMQR